MRIHRQNFTSVVLAAALTVVFLLGSPSQAAVVYDEFVSGDLGPSVSPTAIGALSLDSNSVVGSLLDVGDEDALTFVINPGTELTSLVVSRWEDDPSSPDVSFPVFLLDQSNSVLVNSTLNFGVNLLPQLLGTVGAGTHLFGILPERASIASYQFDFTVSPVPLPAALPLFLTALAGLGVFARRRRRQEANAS